jgi:hypothetical protein
MDSTIASTIYHIAYRNNFMINIEDLTLKQLNEINKLCNISKDHPYKIGQSYFFRTVTHYYTGRLLKVFDSELLFEDVCWIPDTGRFSDSFKTGKHNEVEPMMGNIIIGRGSIIDCSEWNLKLPKDQV